ncbi:MAG: hypothetical protein DI539_20300 [Flavobacterium psychrophilum]|nr:MAG: hypothetical protein DI539_20300 [Flavobacterium psychrophilum]
MKMFSFIISVIAFLGLASYIIFDFPDFRDANSLIYISLLFILVLMSVTGILINMPVISRSSAHRKMKDSNKHMHA